MIKIFKTGILIVSAGTFLCSCAAPSAAPRQNIARSQWRSVDAMPAEVYADTIPVVKFREVVDAMARDLVIQPFVGQAASPPVITIRQIENKTGLDLDETIFQETIRVKLMQHARGTVLFRDDVSYRDIIRERIQQSGEDVTVTLTDSVVRTNTTDRMREREYETGNLSGLGGSYEKAKNVEEESAMEMEQSGTVKGGIADADYFLRGIIYQVNEQNVQQPQGGMSYFQYQFRVTDARSGLIVWEKMLSSKLEGAYTPVQTPPPSQVNQQVQGQVPPGWPTGVQQGQSNQGQNPPTGWPVQGNQNQQSTPSWP